MWSKCEFKCHWPLSLRFGISKGELKSQYDKEAIVGSNDSSVIDQIVKQKNFPIKHQAPKLKLIWLFNWMFWWPKIKMSIWFVTIQLNLNWECSFIGNPKTPC